MHLYWILNFKEMVFWKTCTIRAVTRNIHMQQVIVSATSQYVLTIQEQVPYTSKLFINVWCIGQTLWEKAVLEKNERCSTGVPASRCTFQSTKSEMRPTFQNIDCFKHETGSIIGKLTFSTVNPEKFLAYNSSLWSRERSKFLILEYCETRLFARSSLHARSMKPTLMIFFHVSFSTHNGSLYTRA